MRPKEHKFQRYTRGEHSAGPRAWFWSLTMYNEKQLFAANPIDRYAIGDRDKLAFNPDVRSLHPARVARPRQRVELATGSSERSLHDEYASVLAEA
jgi:hypothetical protein